MMIMMSNAAQAAEHSRYADKLGREARKSAEFAARQYDRAREYFVHARWLTRHPDLWDAETTGTPEQWESWGRSALHLADSTLQRSFDLLSSIKLYRELAKSARARAREDAERVAEYRAAQDAGTFEHGHYGQEPVLRHAHEGGGQDHDHKVEQAKAEIERESSVTGYPFSGYDGSDESFEAMQELQAERDGEVPPALARCSYVRQLVAQRGWTQAIEDTVAEHYGLPVVESAWHGVPYPSLPPVAQPMTWMEHQAERGVLMF